MASSDELGRRISVMLNELLKRKNHSVETLSAISGVDEHELQAVSNGQTLPTLNFLWKIANALGVSFGSLIAEPRRPSGVVLRKTAERIIASSDGGLKSRALLPPNGERLVEFYELTLAPNHLAKSEAHGAGTLESLVIVRGRVEVTVGKQPTQTLEEGDSIVFEGDVPHSYRNLEDCEALLYLVMSYVDLPM